MKNRADTRLPISRPCMSLNATITVSTSPAATSCSSSSRDNGASPRTRAFSVTRCWCAGRSRRPVARSTRARCAVRATPPRGNRRRRTAGWPGHRLRCRGADQRGRVDLDRRAVVVADDAGEVGDPWMAAVDDHQTGEAVQPGRCQFPGQFAADAIADQHAPTDVKHIEDAHHRLGSQAWVRADDDRAQRRGVQTLAHRVVGGECPLSRAQQHHDGALLRTGVADLDGKPVDGSHHRRRHHSKLQSIGPRAGRFRAVR